MGVANAQAVAPVQVEIDFTTGVDNTGTLLDEQPAGTNVTSPEATAAGTSLDITLSAISAGGTFDAAGSSTGVNTGQAGTVEATQFDGGEFATFFFSQDVEFLSGDFINIGNGEELTFTTSNGGNFSIINSNTGIVDDVFDFGGFSLPAGETFTLTGTTAGGIGIENLIVNVVPAAVPEPSSAALLGLLGLGIIACRRR